MELDNITYGNPNQHQLDDLLRESYLDYLFPIFSEYKQPLNSSEATKQELNSIVDYIKSMNEEENKTLYSNRYNLYDKSILDFIKNGLVKGGQDQLTTNKLIDSLAYDIKPILLKLKYHFQRPRPYQLAQYYKLKLFPFQSLSADTPSYPSGHAFQGKVITEVVGTLFPSTYSFMKDLFDDICYSRLYLGLHYQSDIDMGILFAELLLESDEFRAKYQI
jgi:hypothetical protein